VRLLGPSATRTGRTGASPPGGERLCRRGRITAAPDRDAGRRHRKRALKFLTRLKRCRRDAGHEELALQGRDLVPPHREVAESNKCRWQDDIPRVRAFCGASEAGTPFRTARAR